MGITVGAYWFEGEPPSDAEIRRRLTERSELWATIAPSLHASVTLQVPTLGEHVSLYRAGKDLHLEYGSFPTSTFLYAHLDAAIRELGGKRAIDRPILPLASKRWSELGRFERFRERTYWARWFV